jgi:hypothetical protein
MRHAAAQPRDPVQPIDDVVPTPAELSHHRLGCILRPSQCLDTCPLRECGRVGVAVDHQARDRRDQLAREEPIAQPPAGQSIDIREAVQSQPPRG